MSERAMYKHWAAEDADWADRHTMCLRRGTAARIVTPTGGWWREKNRPILSCTNETGRCGCVHAEPQAILNAPHDVQWSGATMISTLSPCTACANLIAVTGRIEEVWYLRTLDHDLRGLEILAAAGVWSQRL